VGPKHGWPFFSLSVVGKARVVDSLVKTYRGCKMVQFGACGLGERFAQPASRLAAPSSLIGVWLATHGFTRARATSPTAPAKASARRRTTKRRAMPERPFRRHPASSPPSASSGGRSPRMRPRGRLRFWLRGPFANSNPSTSRHQLRNQDFSGRISERAMPAVGVAIRMSIGGPLVRPPSGFKALWS